MTDPRRILPITDQYSQYGPWGIRLPDGPGQVGATIYFNTQEEAERYMREHPWGGYAGRGGADDERVSGN